MFIPLSDAPNPRGTPIVTYLLIAANVLIYLFFTLPLSGHQADLSDPALRVYLEAIRESVPPGVTIQEVLRQLSAYDLFVFAHGYKPGTPELGDLFASIFLHGGFMHLLGNMVFLWIYGDNVEGRLGRLPFLFWYLMTGVAATLVFSVFAGHSQVPLVGASGAISGVLGFYFLWFPRNTVRVFVFLFPFFMNVVAIPARIVLGAYLLIDNLLPFLFGGGAGGGGVAHGAHIGGFVAGLAAAWVLARREAPVSPGTFAERDARPDTGVPEEADTIEAALAQERMGDAARMYFAIDPAASRRLLSADDSLRLGDWLAASGHADAALVVYKRHIRDFPTGPSAARAHVGAGRVRLEHLRQVAPAYQHFLEALDLSPDAETEAAARDALARIAGMQKFRVSRS